VVGFVVGLLDFMLTVALTAGLGWLIARKATSVLGGVEAERWYDLRWWQVLALAAAAVGILSMTCLSSGVHWPLFDSPGLLVQPL